MIPRRVYNEAMEESLKNAKALVQESVLVAKNVSMTHALMLKNLAIEEVAKSYACWMVVAGIIPRNHPLVRTKGKKSVFRNHDVKNTMYTALAGSLSLSDLKRRGHLGGGTPTNGELLGIGLAASAIGSVATQRRFEWMYVDITKDENGKYSVSSPLKMDNHQKAINYSGIKAAVRFIERTMEYISKPDFKEYREDRRKWFIENDPDFPDKPHW